MQHMFSMSFEMTKNIREQPLSPLNKRAHFSKKKMWKLYWLKPYSF